MNKINNIFDHVSYSNVISTVDFYSVPLHISGLSERYPNDNLVQTDNQDYVSSNLRPNPLVNLSLSSSSSALIDAETEAELAQINVERNVDANTGLLVSSAEVFGIGNDAWLATGRGDNSIIGVASIEAFASLSAESNSQDESFAIANSESNVGLNLLAIGLGNNGTIVAGGGDDLIGGIADTTTKSEANAESLAENQGFGLSDAGTAEANASAFANSSATTYGIANSGGIFSNRGNDVIFGLANSDSNSQAFANAIANSNSDDLATAIANARAIAITQESTVGILNQGRIGTGVGDDTIIGVAFNAPAARAGADAVANGESNNTNANVETFTFSDTSEVIAIGIDNSQGWIGTSKGHDQLFAYGNDIGILGGEDSKIWLGRGNDKVYAYSETTAIQNEVVALGRGNDYFQAAIGELDALTGEFHRAENQANALVDTEVLGHGGSDTFEIGDFAGNSTIDGGKNFDTLRLFGDVDSYQFTVGASEPDVLTIENSGSILTVRDVEAIYLGDSHFEISDFA